MTDNELRAEGLKLAIAEAVPNTVYFKWYMMSPPNQR